MKRYISKLSSRQGAGKGSVGSSFTGMRVALAGAAAAMPLPGRSRRGGHSAQTAPMAVTPRRKEALVVTMAAATAQEYIESGQLARLAAALDTYSQHFDEVLLVTADRVDFTDKVGGQKVRHARSRLPLPVGRTLRTALAVMAMPKSVRRTVAVLALDEEGTFAGRFAAAASGSRLTLSSGAPWSPPRNRSLWSGWRSWPVRHGLSGVQQVLEWRGAGHATVADSAERRTLPECVDADLFCPLATTDPLPPEVITAFIGPDDTAAAVMLMGAAQRLARHKHGVVVRAFVVTPGAAGEVQAKALQGEAVERRSDVQFIPLPAPEMLPDLLARPRLSVSFGSRHSLPYVLRSMACGIPCVVAAADGEEADGQQRSGPDWHDFVLKTAQSDVAVTRGVEAVLREPALRARLGREGRRYVIARHSVEAIQREEAALLRQAPARTEDDSDFDAEAEAVKLAAMTAMVTAMQEEAA